MTPASVETIGMTMRFGTFTALEDVSVRLAKGSVHALLGENGAGKSTFVKCMMGFYHATEGQMLVDGREARIANPRDAHALGLGMVYQHFTLVPALTAAENLVISRDAVPAVLDLPAEQLPCAVPGFSSDDRMLSWNLGRARAETALEGVEVSSSWSGCSGGD